MQFDFSYVPLFLFDFRLLFDKYELEHTEKLFEPNESKQTTYLPRISLDTKLEELLRSLLSEKALYFE